jgi:hypothetical protein
VRDNIYNGLVAPPKMANSTTSSPEKGARMATYPHPSTLAHFPAELIESVTRDAESDAERVFEFLDLIGLRPVGEGADRIPVKLPAYFLLRLAATLRLWSWEQKGLLVHQEAGLPSATDALRELGRSIALPGSLHEEKQTADQLSQGVLRVAIDRLAWSGRAYLDTDLAIGEPDEDTLVQAMADLLWAHRHDGNSQTTTD